MRSANAAPSLLTGPLAPRPSRDSRSCGSGGSSRGSPTPHRSAGGRSAARRTLCCHPGRSPAREVCRSPAAHRDTCRGQRSRGPRWRCGPPTEAGRACRSPADHSCRRRTTERSPPPHPQEGRRRPRPQVPRPPTRGFHRHPHIESQPSPRRPRRDRRPGRWGGAPNAWTGLPLRCPPRSPARRHVCRSACSSSAGCRSPAPADRRRGSCPRAQASPADRPQRGLISLFAVRVRACQRPHGSTSPWSTIGQERHTAERSPR
mmetsp:Transcript_71748/g.214230  ORF Transcript_71748/g.214230 Transcript_71748/m.214230 type:complete len:261 (+) Transcript_71748:38-820(+)